MPLLALQGICKRFGGVVANDEITFTVARGSLVGLIGPNGSGKTTLFNCIAGQNPPDAGEVRFDDRLITALPPAHIARLGLMRTFQSTGVYDGMTALQNMQVSASHAGQTLAAGWQRPDAAARERAHEWLGFVGLAARSGTLAGELSYGQRRLLEFAMALMSSPRLLLLDEPTAGVSPALVPELLDRLRRANTELGITVLFIEHNLQVVMALAQQVHCLARGRLLASGTPDEIRANKDVIEAYLGTR